MDFDVALAFPKVMAKIAVLGKQLGPKGLMPNPKTGTLIEDVEKAIGEFKKGKSKWTCDETGAIHTVVGKVGTPDKEIHENIMALVKAVSDTLNKQPSAIVKNVVLSATMGAGVKVDKGEVVGA
jgi:large subunit ribosomal protein L1